MARRRSVKAQRTKSAEDPPEPRFTLRQELAAPQAVVESGQLRIVSYEWGKGNPWFNVDQWMYGVVDADGPSTAAAFYASEVELVLWNPDLVNGGR